MDKRQAGFARIHAVETQHKRIAEAKLAGLRRQAEALAVAQRDTVAALNADGPLHGLFVNSMARNLRRLGAELAAVTERWAAEEERLLLHARRAKVAARAAAAAAAEHRRARERVHLAEIIESALARDASLP